MWYAIFLGIPALSVVICFVSLIVFLLAPNGSKMRKIAKVMTIVFAIISIILIGILVSLIGLFYLALANM